MSQFVPMCSSKGGLTVSRASQENERVRAAIVDALFSLMGEKEFSKITVTDVVTRAGVARASWYRNFSSKEEVVEDYVDSLYRGLAEACPQDGIALPKDQDALAARFAGSFSYLCAERECVLLLCHNGFGMLVLDVMNRHAEDALGDMPARSLTRYGIYLATGAAFNVLVRWLEDGAQDDPAKLAEVCAAALSGQGR